MATRRLYRSRYGEVFGVCKGLADWKDLPLGPVRTIFILGTIFSGFFPVAILYLVAALVLPLNPYEEAYGPGEPRQHRARQERRDQRDYTAAWEEVDDEEPAYHADAHEEKLRQRYEELKKKVEEMESQMFDKEKAWDEKFQGEDKA